MRWQLGLGIAFGVPALVFVSLGPVASLTGPASFLVWGLSALMGALMAVVFAELIGLYPSQTGGIAVAAALSLRRRSHLLAVLCQWSYWFGWSCALAINGLIVGIYVQQLLPRDAPSGIAYLVGAAILLMVGALNHYGIKPSAWLQAALAVCAVGPMLVLAAGPWIAGDIDARNFLPLEPPGGWFSWQGVAALGGGLFIAGWSAYGCEISSAYSTEYRNGNRDARRTMLVVGAASVAAYVAIPLALIGSVGLAGVQADPTVALLPFVQRVTGQASLAVVGLLLVSLLLGLNMVVIASSRTLFQMARNGYTWEFLSRLNRRGVPAGAIRFDLAFNVALMAVLFVLNRGQSSQAPIALLAAANVGYFIAIVLALAAAAVMRMDEPDRYRSFRAPRGFMWLGLGLAALNCLMLAGAGIAWGWVNIGLGLSILTAFVGIFILTTRKPAPAVELAASSAE